VLEAEIERTEGMCLFNVRNSDCVGVEDCCVAYPLAKYMRVLMRWPGTVRRTLKRIAKYYHLYTDLIEGSGIKFGPGTTLPAVLTDGEGNVCPDLETIVDHLGGRGNAARYDLMVGEALDLILESGYVGPDDLIEALEHMTMRAIEHFIERCRHYFGDGIATTMCKSLSW